jgi:hypothetical protein
MKYILIFALFLFVSCADNTTTTIKREQEANQRIYGKEYTIYKGTGYQIIEVDGVEYITTTRGGICPLVKK